MTFCGCGTVPCDDCRPRCKGCTGGCADCTPNRESTISPEEIDRLIEEGQESAKALREDLDRVFRPGPDFHTLILD